MQILKFLTLITIFACLAFSQTKLESELDSLSYALGMDIGNNLKSNSNYSDNIDVDKLAAGIIDAFKGSARLSTEEFQRVIRTFQMKLKAEQAAQEPSNASFDREAQKKFLEDNAKRPEVIETSSGLQYEVLKKGSGKSPSASDVVKVHYHGTLIDGSVFDSSVERGEPIEFALNRVIAGWTEGVQLMKEGAKYRFYIPSELGYGERGAGQQIPPGATLIFEVELLAVK